MTENMDVNVGEKRCVPPFCQIFLSGGVYPFVNVWGEGVPLVVKFSIIMVSMRFGIVYGARCED